MKIETLETQISISNFLYLDGYEYDDVQIIIDYYNTKLSV